MATGVGSPVETCVISGEAPGPVRPDVVIEKGWPVMGKLHSRRIALSNRGRRGGKKDSLMPERLVKRLVRPRNGLEALGRITDNDCGATGDARPQASVDGGWRGRMQNQLEALLERPHIKLSSLVSDLLGVSARRMMQALRQWGNRPGSS